MIVLHYTAGVSGESSAIYLTRPDVAASAHLVIGRDGKVFQLVPFNIEAWHAGRSWYAGRAELNHYSIGIELDNLGKLRQKGKKFFAECGREVPVEEVYTDDKGDVPTFWHRYTRVQVQVLAQVCRLLGRGIDILASLHECTGENVGRGVQVTGIQLPDSRRGRALGHHEPEDRPGTGAGIRLEGSILDL